MKTKYLNVLKFFLKEQSLPVIPDENDCVQFIQLIRDLAASLGSEDAPAARLICSYWENSKRKLAKYANENDYYGNLKEIEDYIDAIISPELGIEKIPSTFAEVLDRKVFVSLE